MNELLKHESTTTGQKQGAGGLKLIQVLFKFWYFFNNVKKVISRKMLQLYLTSWEVRITNTFCFWIIIAQIGSNCKNLQNASIAWHRVLGSFLIRCYFFRHVVIVMNCKQQSNLHTKSTYIHKCFSDLFA